MNTSPLQFAKDFGKLKSDLASQPAADLKLLLLIDFWPRLELYQGNKAYRSYFDEYIPLLLHLISPESLHDLTLPETEGVLNILHSLDRGETANHVSELQKKVRLVTIQLAKKLFYVGCVEDGVKLCAELVGGDSVISSEFNELDDLSEFGALKVVCDRFKDKRPELYGILKSILDTWEGERETLSHDRANCLFVEKDTYPVIPAKAGIQQWRGRMRVLQGKVELLSKSAKTDQLAFENQIKSPDDPFIGVAYDSFKAVRQVFKAEGFKDKAGAFYHAHFSIKAGGVPGRSEGEPGRGCTHTFTGDSIGLAFGLVSYTQLLKPEIMRQERFIASDVAFTGGVDEDGLLTPVNEETLGVKVERAFFSPIKYLALPEANVVAAKEHLEEMKKRYHRRRLHLVPAERLNEVIENHNVVRAEKVCMGEFVVRKVYRYSRMTKVQVPLLAALLLVFLAILFPKWTPWFDWHIAKIEVIGNRFRTLNADGRTIWWSEEYQRTLEQKDYDVPLPNPRFWAVDIDKNNRDELFFVPVDKRYPGIIQLFDDKGDILWEKEAFRLTSYPGDKAYDSIGIEQMGFYPPPDIIPYVDDDDNIFVITVSGISFPWRVQLLCFNTKGDIVSGPYISTVGSQRKPLWLDYDNNGSKDLYLFGTNNRDNGSCILVLDPKSLYGVSPPYNNELFLISKMPKGSQLAYVRIPETPLSDEIDVRNNIVLTQYFPTTKSFQLTVVEGTNLIINNKRLRLYNAAYELPAFYYDLDSNLIPISIKPEDGGPGLYSQLLEKTNRPKVSDWSEFYDSLLSEVVVYKDSIIIHYQAAGIDFYKE